MNYRSNQYCMNFCLNIRFCSEFPGVQSKKRNSVNKSSHYYKGGNITEETFPL